MKPKMFFWVLAGVVALLFPSNFLQAQNAWISTEESFPLHRLSGIPYEYYPQPLDWVITSEESSIVFITDYDDEGDNCYLWAAQLNADGDVINYVLANYTQGGFFLGARAFWFPNEDSPDQSFGLLFFSVIIPKNVLDQSQVRYFVDRFDATGTTSRNQELLLDISLPQDQWHSNIWLGANSREGAIGVVMAFSIYEWSNSFTGYWGSQAHFLEYHPEFGVTPAGVKEVKQKNGGRNWILHPYEPVWNGASWMIPAVETRIKTKKDQGGFYGIKWSHKLMALVATPEASGGDIKIKKRTLERDNTRYDVPYKDPMFLPPKPVDLEEESLSDINVVHEHFLLYSKAFIKPNLDDRALTATNYEHYLRRVNRMEKISKPRARLHTPEWTRKFSAHPNWYVPENYNHFSRALYAGENAYFIAQSRSAYFLHQASAYRSKSELQLDLYVFDPYTLNFDWINTSNLKGKTSSFAPILNFYTGAPCLINALSELGRKSFSIDLFFSRF